MTKSNNSYFKFYQNVGNVFAKFKSIASNLARYRNWRLSKNTSGLKVLLFKIVWETHPMKRPIFMLISSIYGILLGAILVISPSEAMKTYGYNSLDFLHNDLSIHLGLLVLILSVYIFLKRNSENKELVTIFRPVKVIQIFID